MKNRWISIALAFVLSAGAALAAEDTPRFSLKITGGTAYHLNGGDLKTVFDSTAERFNLLGIAGSRDFSWKPWGLDINAEIVYRASTSFAVSLGVGYLHKTWNPSFDVSEDFGTSAEQGSETIEAKVVPILISGIYTLPLGNIVHFNVFAGGGIYIGSFRFDSSNHYSEPHRFLQPNWTWDFGQTFQSDSMARLGFHAGLGLEVALAPRMTLCFEALYRLVQFDSIKGDLEVTSLQRWTGGHLSDSFSGPGSTWWFETSNVFGNIFHYSEVAPTKPTSSDEVRPFVFKLEGFTLRAGIKIGLF